jgi:FG-GAP-like repeat
MKPVALLWLTGISCTAIRPANGAGWEGFLPPTRFPMGAPVVCFGADRDINAHGVVVGTNGRGVTVFGGFKNGQFEMSTDIPGGFVVSVAMNYFNADTIPDLVVPNYFGGSFTIYLGTGGAAYSAGQTYTVEGHCTWVTTGDFDGDGKIDIAAAHNGSGQPVNLYIYLGNGDGTFSRFQKYPTQLATPTKIISTTVNADSNLDIAYSFSGPETGALFEGNGDGTFSAPDIIVDVDPTSGKGDSPGFSLADIDHDGNLDWISAQDFIDSVVVRKGVGTGKFVPDIRLFLPHPWDVETADLDGDGDIDIIVSNLDSIVCYIQNPQGTFTSAATIAPVQGAAKLLATDLNDDGFPDLLFSGLDSSFSVAINKGAAETSVGVTTDLPSASALHPNFPNPFNPATTIEYTIGVGGQGSGVSSVRLVVYDILGREVETLVHGPKPPGSYEVRWDASGFPSGVYICRLDVNADNGQHIQQALRMLLLK